MIYAVLPYYPREGTLESFFNSLKAQEEPYKLIVITAGSGIALPGIQVLNGAKRIYWTESMQLAYRFLLRHGEDSDVVCILNDDLTFDTDFFSNGVKVDFGEILIPQVFEQDQLVDGGIEIDWKIKIFKVGRIDCFSPRGIFMKLKDFRESGGFCPWLPHYASDYEWSMRLIKKGLKPRRVGRVETTTISKKAKVPIFSKLNNANPIYWTIFLLLCARNRYLLLNLIRAWVHPFLRKNRDVLPKSF